jgi:hypothetical protein
LNGSIDLEYALIAVFNEKGVNLLEKIRIEIALMIFLEQVENIAEEQ